MRIVTSLNAISLMTIFTSSLYSGALSSSEISNMVAKIKEERVGISLIKLNDTVNPFIIKVQKKEEIPLEKIIDTPLEVVYRLKAILNHAAFIDDKWYKEGDTLGNYQVGHITTSSVALLSSSGNKVLSLKKKKKSLIKLNRGYK